MTREEVLERLKELFEDVLELDPDVVTEELSQETCEDWDSLAQITLLVSVENEFSVKFDAEEMTSMKSVAKIIDAILAK